jgi:hypothetical protein
VILIRLRVSWRPLAAIVVCSHLSWIVLPAQAPARSSVLVLDFDGDGFQLTSAADGVTFDIDADGTPEQIGWTAAGSDDGLLALDNNANGQIDDGSELVGSRLALPHGQRPGSGANALALPLNGVRVDGEGRPVQPRPRPLPRLDATNPTFHKLLVWTDLNHDGRSQRPELSTVADARVVEFLLGFRRILDVHPEAVDRHGNRRLFEGSFSITVRRSVVLMVMREIEFVRR